MITKTKTVLDFDCISGFTVYFYSPEDGESEINSNYEVNMLESTWKELGSPKRITVTIEPGDLLNEGPAALITNPKSLPYEEPKTKARAIKMSFTMPDTCFGK